MNKTLFENAIELMELRYIVHDDHTEYSNGPFTFYVYSDKILADLPFTQKSRKFYGDHLEEYMFVEYAISVGFTLGEDECKKFIEEEKKKLFRIDKINPFLDE